MADRCAVHPARPATDDCPVCARPRCAADADAAPGGGCLACRGVVERPGARPPVDLRALVGSLTVTHLVAVLAGAVASQYVEVRWFSVLVPAGVGIACGAAAEKGAGRARGNAIRAVAIGYALVATALGFRFEPAGVEVFDDVRTVGLPYLAAAAGAWQWTAPPSRRAVRKAARPG